MGRGTGCVMLSQGGRGTRHAVLDMEGGRSEPATRGGAVQSDLCCAFYYRYHSLVLVFPW